MTKISYQMYMTMKKNPCGNSKKKSIQNMVATKYICDKC